VIIKEPRHVASELRYALRKGVFVSIEDLAVTDRGLACNCVCPNCSVALEACMGEVRQHYFRHSKDSSDCGVTNESVLHAYAKQCLMDAVGTDKLFNIPRIEKGKYIPKTLSGEISDSVTITAAVLEYRDGNTGMVTDVRLTASNGWVVNVEIKVTHGIDETKATKIITGKAFTLEIALDAHALTSFKLEDVKKDIFGLNGKTVWNHPEAQSWQHNPKLTSSAKSVLTKPIINPTPRLPPRHVITIPQNVSYELQDCYLSHNVTSDDNGLNVSLEFCDKNGEVLNLPVIRAHANYYDNVFSQLQPGTKINVSTYNGEVVNVRKH